MVKRLLLAALALPGVAFAAEGPTGQGRGCLPTKAENAGVTAAAPYHRLDQLPPAAEILTVIRSVDGCQKPVVVRYGIGGNPLPGGPAR